MTHEIVVSHPSRQGHLYRVPAGYQQLGVPTTFLTGLYFKPQAWPYRWIHHLPPKSRSRLHDLLQRRRLDSLDEADVRQLSGPLPELLYRVFGYGAGNAVHDRLASAWISNHYAKRGSFLFHGFQGSSLSSLRRARSLGASTVLEATYPPTLISLIKTEYARLGLETEVQALPERDLAEMREAELLVAQSPFMVRSLMEIGIPKSRIQILPVPIDTELYRPATREPGRKTHFLFAGRLSIAKGLHHLLDAWQRARPAQSELLLAGHCRGRFEAELLERHRKRYQLLGLIPFTEMPEIYRKADVFICPSLGEAGPFVVLEALASGLPCIVSANAASVVRNGVEGLVVPNGDADALVAAIERMARDHELRARMRAAARARALEFGTHRHPQRLRRLLDLAVGRQEPDSTAADAMLMDCA